MRAVKDENVPGIVPLFSGFDKDRLVQLQKSLISNFKIETEIYHFDFNGNPLQSDYRSCLALPVHGMITNMDTVVSTLPDVQR